MAKKAMGNPSPVRPECWEKIKNTRADNCVEELQHLTVRLPISNIAYLRSKPSKTAWLRRVIAQEIAREQLDAVTPKQ